MLSFGLFFLLSAAAQGGNLRGHEVVQSTANGYPGTNYFYPRYNYSHDDLQYKSMQGDVHTSYACKYDMPIPGINLDQSVLILAPCVFITPHWHSDTYELNFVLQHNLTWWIFPAAEPTAEIPVQHGVVPQGSLLVSPQGVEHLLFNDNCDILPLMHTFPTSIDEDFTSTWKNMQSMPSTYLNDVMPTSPGGAVLVKKSLKIPDGIHTVSTQCMTRCGITEQFYEKFTCPKEVPLKTTVMEPFTSEV